MSVIDSPDLTDDSDADDADGVMIALLPTSDDWCKIDLPHMTLVYAGKIKDLQPTDFNELAKDAAALASLATPMYFRVIEKATFGPPEEQVDVYRLMPTTQLWAMRRAVEDWNASEFPFNPHVTIGPAGTPVDFAPQTIGFDRLYVAWGDESLTFMMNRGSNY